jgi:hypothetical protein
MTWKIKKKMVKRYEIYGRKYGRILWNDMENKKENGEIIWKIWKKIVKWYGKYGRKVDWIVKWYEKYGKQ